LPSGCEISAGLGLSDGCAEERASATQDARGLQSAARARYAAAARVLALSRLLQKRSSGNLLTDLTDCHAEVVAGSPLEIDGQPLKMHPKILETLSVVQPNILVDNLLHGF
jgi:hypothetical protein